MSRPAGPIAITASGSGAWRRPVPAVQSHVHEDAFVRQGEVASKGSWAGNAQGGVKAPEPLILPDPATRFVRMATRLAALSAGHPMTEWLRFMAQIARAQHVVATTFAPFREPTAAAIRQAVDARMPPLSADGHRRDPIWHDGLILLLDSFDGSAAPASARAVMASLRGRPAAEVEVLADGFLQGDVAGADAGAVFYVAAALQVYFTGLAAVLPAADLRLLPE